MARPNGQTNRLESQQTFSYFFGSGVRLNISPMQISYRKNYPDESCIRENDSKVQQQQLIYFSAVLKNVDKLRQLGLWRLLITDAPRFFFRRRPLGVALASRPLSHKHGVGPCCSLRCIHLFEKAILLYFYGLFKKNPGRLGRLDTRFYIPLYYKPAHQCWPIIFAF